jgi:hypothetical protein
VEAAFFSLDEHLGLLAHHLTPAAQQAVVRLSSWMSFAKAAREVHALLGVHVSRSTAQRQCLYVGQCSLHLQDEQAHPQAQIPSVSA